jgi:hypothetical protein
MLIYKCDYCGAEIPFDGSTTTCPACGAKFKTGAEPIDTDTYEEGSFNAPGSFDAPPATAAISAKKRTVSFITGFFCFFGVILFIGVIYGFVQVAKEEIETGGSSYADNVAYREEGHTPYEEYAGDIVLTADISDYNVISWSEEPKLIWGDSEWNSDTLMIYGKIHNNSEKDIDAVNFSFDIVWETDEEPKYASASVYDLFAGQDEYVDDEVYVYLPKTYDDVKEIKLTEVRIQYN